MAFGDQYGRTLDTSSPIYADWQAKMAGLTSKGAGGLWNAYTVLGGADEQDRYINPYDTGGGYNSLAQAQKAAMSSGGNLTYRQPSSDFGFEQYVIPALAAATGFGAAGLGPLAGAGAGAAEGAGAVAPWGAGEAVSGPYPSFGSAPAAAGAVDAGTDLGIYNPGQTNPYVTGASGADATAATNTAAAAGGGVGAGTGVGTAAGSASAISRIFAGNGTPADYASIIGSAAPALLGAYAANKQTGAYSDLAAKLAEYGAPSRARYEGSFAPGFSMSQDPGFTDALNQAGKASMHALSTFGNPAGSPNAWAQSQSDLYSKFAYPALQTYRNQNANAGGISALTTAAPQASTAAIGSQAGVYGAIGGGIADIFNPQPTLAQTMAQYTRMLRGA